MPTADRLDADRWDRVGASVIHADCYPCAREWRIASQRLDSDGLFFIWHGLGWVEQDGERREARPHDLFVLKRGQRFSAGHDPLRPVTVLSVGFRLRDEGGGDGLRPHALPDRMRLPRARAATFQTLFTDLVGLHGDGAPWAAIAARGALVRLVAEAIRLTNELPGEARSATATPIAGDDSRASAVLAHIDANLARPLTLAGLARVADLTPAHFAAAFRRWTGRSPMEHLRRRRIEVARAMLGESDAPLERVAAAVGFVDPYHFSRVFSRLVGMPPGRWRRSMAHPFAP
ncbi:MAG: helix-turn-helix transcriptional regulator [Planctomycetes bacterium]|nr:helix-turn-helix transcriptional regulator [Planctomycetota bacterium]